MTLYETAPTKDSLTLAQWLDKWLRVYAPLRCKSLKTIERYRGLANYVIKGRTPELAWIAATDLPDLTHITLEPALLSLLDVPGLRHERLSSHSVRHIGSLVSVALDKAWRLDLIPVNPMKKVEMPRMDIKDTRSLTRAEIWAIRDVCRGDWLADFIELALGTGCRRGELLALEWTDINWKERSISISKSLEQTREGLRIKGTKGGKPRVFKLPKIALDSMKNQKRTGHARLIFADDHGGYLKPDLISQLIVRRIRKAGINDASLHSLRHAHASNLLSRGVPLPAVSARLGHADANITARIYCHALPLDDERACNEWDRMFVGGEAQQERKRTPYPKMNPNTRQR